MQTPMVKKFLKKFFFPIFTIGATGENRFLPYNLNLKISPRYNSTLSIYKGGMWVWDQAYAFVGGGIFFKNFLRVPLFGAPAWWARVACLHGYIPIHTLNTQSAFPAISYNAQAQFNRLYSYTQYTIANRPFLISDDILQMLRDFNTRVWLTAFNAHINVRRYIFLYIAVHFSAVVMMIRVLIFMRRYALLDPYASVLTTFNAHINTRRQYLFFIIAAWFSAVVVLMCQGKIYAIRAMNFYVSVLATFNAHINTRRYFFIAACFSAVVVLTRERSYTRITIVQW